MDRPAIAMLKMDYIVVQSHTSLWLEEGHAQGDGDGYIKFEKRVARLAVRWPK